MAKMSLNSVPAPTIGDNGHIVDTTPQVKDVVVLKTEDSANLRVVANNIDTIDKVAGSLLSIKNVANDLSSIKSVLAIDDKLDIVISMKSSMKRLIPISDELNTLANSIDDIIKAAENVDTLIELGNNVDELRFLYDIREHVISVNSVKDKLLEIVNTMSSLNNVEANLDDINLVALHMLAVEIVAQNLELLRFFNINANLFQDTVTMYPDLRKFIDYIDLAKELVNVVQTLPDTLQEFKFQMDKMATDLKDEFTEVADERLEKLQEAYNHFFNESLKLRESVLDVDKALVDFKIKIMEEHTYLKEGVSKFERDLAKTHEQFSYDLAQAEKAVLERVSELDNKVATIEPDLIRDSIFNTINPQIEGLNLKINLELQKIATLNQDLDSFKIDVRRDIEEIRQELVEHSARMTELDVKMEAVNTTVDKLKEILNKVAAFNAIYDHNWEVI
ncbi:hypothetical protein [Campylobacter devanensis]|uniref:hypothetical protein n=1 Tax=Campylobacter devanensis TaxID=3161138 RepID=UPI000A3416EE|nr:hypothetical protein [Campylobacter sp. P0107]